MLEQTRIILGATIYRTFRLMLPTIILVGISVPAISAERANNQQFERVGVISVAGDRLFQFHIGQLAFGNREDSTDIHDWKLDDQWEHQIVASAAGQHTEIDFVDLENVREPLYAAYPHAQSPSIIRKERTLDFSRIAPDFQRLATDNDVDAFLVVSSSFKHADPLYFEGPTILTEMTFAGPTAYYWLVVELTLVDGATGLPIADKRVGKSGRVMERAPKELKAKRYPEYSPEEVTFLRERFVAMPEPFWSDTVSKLLGGS